MHRITPCSQKVMLRFRRWSRKEYAAFVSLHLKLVHCIFFFNLFKKGIEILHGPQPIPVNCNKMTFDFIPLKETF